MSGSLEAVRVGVLALDGLGWVLVYSLAAGALLGVMLRAVLFAMRHRSAWARYALCCAALVLFVGSP